MFFSGDVASRRKVELRGRSSKESDRQAILNRARDEREQRHRARLRQQGAVRIQKCYRARRDVRRNQALIRQEFARNYGEWSDRAGRDVFKPSSKFLPELFYFLSPTNSEDFMHLAGVCRHFCSCLQEAGEDVMAVVSNGNYPSQRGAVNYRVRVFTTLCLRALQYHRESLKEELLLPLDFSSGKPVPSVVSVIVSLACRDYPWAGSLIEHLTRDKLFHMLRDLLLTVEAKDTMEASGKTSSLEHLVLRLSLQCVRRAEYLKQLPFSWSVSAQVFSIPLLWQRVPLLKQLSITEGLWAYVVHHTSISLSSVKNSLPPETANFPSLVCFLGNLLEISRAALTQKGLEPELVTKLANVAQYLMSSIPVCYQLSPLKQEKIEIPKDDDDDEDEEMVVDTPADTCLPESALVDQLQHASNSLFLKNMVEAAFSRHSSSSIADSTSVAAICAFLYTSFSVFDRKTVITNLAYNTDLVLVLWRYINSCHTNRSWPAIHLECPDEQLTPELLGWVLPLLVICPVFSHLLFSMDNDEFYNMQRPLTIQDVVQLVHIAKEGLWQLLWVFPGKPAGFDASDMFILQNLRQLYINVSSALLAELHDRNGKREFAPPEIFHAKEAVGFIQEEGSENSKTRYLLNKAPFLIPFTNRFRVYTARLEAARRSGSPHPSRLRIRVQRNRIIEDTFAAFIDLSSDDLHDMIRVTYVNELGVEEAGVDGGGLFKDFMETITKAGFDIQYGLFKETADHLLYPNPASHLVNESHLDYFEFLGKILAKAMFEGILVDIHFATFFLRKLRNKPNYLHDLPSLDPELYKNLLYLKNHPDIVSQLDLYFVIEDNEYGEQHEVELVAGGKDIQVTGENVFRYIHQVANHRLNNQIRHQSSSFLNGFQQLISPESLDMFNEHELQIIISGSEENTDIDDLRLSTQYGGGYHEEHPVIRMFWEVVKSMDASLQQKFIKFVTGCSRGPLLGFKYLDPQFCIQKTVTEEDSATENLDRLPTSATCMNLLKLPPYKSKEMIREKLVYAITAGAGFDLS